ncbi:MAG: TraR/DksA C4-type zinc finger protein [Deltaproteobacteria bacterium]|nr:TraR/DksA C4-type zinc finger protein [Deltaproteobacteria bacterium]
MRKNELDALRSTLLHQRSVLLKEVADTEADLATLEAMRESELEECAQDERLTRLLDRLDRRAKAEVEDIDRALARCADGRYGICTQCAQPIAAARLRVLPAAALCITCASALGRRPPAAAAAEPESEPPARADLPPEYALLSDHELQDAVSAQLVADGRLDLDELRIVCRHGVLYLDGDVPSAAEHQILLHTVTDLMGLTAVVDRVRIEQAPWQREDRAPGELPPAERVPWQEPATTEDVVEAGEDGADYDAPDRPLPDEE